MIRWLAAAVVLIGGLWTAAHYPDLAWVGVVGLIVAYVLTPH